MRSSNSPKKINHSSSTVNKLITTLSAVGKASKVAASARRSISPDSQSSLVESDEKSSKKISSKFIMTPNKRIDEQESLIKTLKSQIVSLNKSLAEQAQNNTEKEHCQKNLIELKDLITKTTEDYNGIVDNISAKLANLTSDNIKIKKAFDELQIVYKDVHAKYEVVKNYPKLEPMLTTEKSINTEINALLTQNYQKYSENFSIVKSEKEGYFDRLKEVIHAIDGEREDHRKALSQWAAEKIQLSQEILELKLKNDKSFTEISKLSELNKSYESQVKLFQTKLVFYEEELKEKQRQDIIIKELTKSLGEVQTNYNIAEKFEEERKKFGGFELTALLDQTNLQLTEIKKLNTELTTKLLTSQKDLDICNLRLNVILPKEKAMLSIEQQLQDSNDRVSS
jgi:chromosome segregation ATPase